MSALNHPDSILEKFCNDTIEQRQGDISRLPKDGPAEGNRQGQTAQFVSAYDR
jgi:hypothetical protein